MHPPKTDSPASRPDPGENKCDRHSSGELKIGSVGMMALFVGQMSEQLTICLIVVTANLVGMLMICSALSQAFTKITWRKGGVVSAIALILLSQLLWFAALVQGSGLFAAETLWLGNWLSSAFAIVLLWKSAATIPTALHDAARMDGLGGFASWRYATLPFIRRDLFILGMFTVMATLLPVWGVMNSIDPYGTGTIFSLFPRNTELLVKMLGGSLIGAIPLIGILFVVKRTG